MREKTKEVSQIKSNNIAYIEIRNILVWSMDLHFCLTTSDPQAQVQCHEAVIGKSKLLRIKGVKCTCHGYLGKQCTLSLLIRCLARIKVPGLIFHHIRARSVLHPPDMPSSIP